MCGIVGYIGKKNCLPILIQGLKKQEYRGYDSAGIAYLNNNNINIIKSIGRISNLEKKINLNNKTTIGIGHTRWATHGGVNETNCHPHQSGDITLVHNGIIENYQELKEKLINNGYNFKSETDTEVACAYIDYEYQNSKNKNMIEILNNCIKIFKGSYAMTIMIKNIPDKLFVIKKESPLVIGIGKEENYIASDTTAYATEILGYIILEDLEIGIITKDNISIYKGENKIDYNIKEINHEDDDNYIDKSQYEHYMLKEINEQSEIINHLNETYLKNLDKIPTIDKYNKIHIIGCGTAYHASMIGKYLIENFNDFEINTYIASEYRYQKIFADENTLVIAASQSGETADTIACLKKAKKLGCKTLGIVNVKNSSIARIVDEVIYTEAGPEIAVASTKAYTSQLYIFSLLALKLGLSKNKINLQKITKEYEKLPKLVDKMLSLNYKNFIKNIWKQKDLFYIGRNIDYITILEGSLKIKEISYIHSEAYQAGELKHGTISLIEKDTGIISLISHEKTAQKTLSNIKEVKARGAYVILLIKKSLNINVDKKCYDELIIIDDTNYLLQPIINIIPLQLLAYQVAKNKKCDIDKPRNLAKSVTVE